MSAAATRESEKMFCASCGTAGVDEIKLKKCNACYLVRYCSVKCQKEHRPKHKKECKKRVAELRDEILFKQPESTHDDDCPICCLPVPIEPSKTTFLPCCSKSICNGCDHVNTKRGLEGKLQLKCPFCREALPKTEKESIDQLMKRVEANDAAAICYLASKRIKKGDYKAAIEYFTRAVALGDVDAHFQLSTFYYHGEGVETDEKRALHHAEKAAIGGHPYARHSLGCVEAKNGRMNRAAKHFIIAANLGHDDSLERVKDLYKAGFVSKEDFAAALRGHQAAIDATKSPQREEAAEFKKWLEGCEKGTGFD